MGEKIDYNRNVGSSEYPVTYLHQRTVALLYDVLTEKRTLYEGGDRNREHNAVYVRLNPNGELSGNLLEGVGRVVVPDPDWGYVGGVLPDLALYGEDPFKPVRIIEVVVTNPPDESKMEKLDLLKRRGVDVVIVTVKSADDLKTLCPVVWQPSWKAGSVYGGDKVGHVVDSAETLPQTLRQLVGEIQRCNPSQRRMILKILRELGSLESIHPLHPGNPLAEQLRSE